MSMFEKLVEQLQKENLEDVVDIFNAEEIDAETLGLVTEEMLDKIGIRPLGKRLKVMKILSDVQKVILIGDSVPENVLDLSQQTLLYSLDVNCTSPGGAIMSIPIPDGNPIVTPIKQEILPGAVQLCSIPSGNVLVGRDQHEIIPGAVQLCSIPSGNVLICRDQQVAHELLPSPLPYPRFSNIILNAEESGNVLLVRARLIKESARFYMSYSHDLSRHYNQICQHLIARFPALKDAIVLPGALINYTKLKKDLAQSVRNHKRPGNSKPRTSAALECSAKVLIKEEVARVEDNLLPMNLAELIKEHKKSKPSKDHIMRLLARTVGNFKDWIEKDVPPTLVEVLEQYPVLRCPEWIIYQAGLLLEVHGDFRKQLEDRLDGFFLSVTNIHKKEQPAEDKGCNYEILTFMESCVNTKKCSSIFLFIEAGCKPHLPTSSTPTLVVVKSSSQEDIMSQAFLFVDKILVCEVKKPTVIGLVALWLCTHYCFNIQYGKGCINMAHVLEDCVLREWGSNSIQNMSVNANASKSRKIVRGSKTETFYGRLKAEGFAI